MLLPFCRVVRLLRGFVPFLTLLRLLNGALVGFLTLFVVGAHKGSSINPRRDTARINLI